MTELSLYEEAMCCSTGVCGPALDDELAEVSAAPDQLEDEYNVESDHHRVAQYRSDMSRLAA